MLYPSLCRIFLFCHMSHSPFIFLLSLNSYNTPYFFAQIYFHFSSQLFSNSLLNFSSNKKTSPQANFHHNSSLFILTSSLLPISSLKQPFISFKFLIFYSFIFRNYLLILIFKFQISLKRTSPLLIKFIIDIKNLTTKK